MSHHRPVYGIYKIIIRHLSEKAEENKREDVITSPTFEHVDHEEIKHMAQRDEGDAKIGSYDMVFKNGMTTIC